MMLPKPRRIESPEYRKFVRNHSCLVKQCWRLPQAHHVIFDGQGRLASKVPDFQCVPLCDKHHNEMHSLGRERFEAVYGLIMYMRIIELMSEFIEEKQADLSSH